MYIYIRAIDDPSGKMRRDFVTFSLFENALRRTIRRRSADIVARRIRLKVTELSLARDVGSTFSLMRRSGYRYYAAKKAAIISTVLRLCRRFSLRHFNNLVPSERVGLSFRKLPKKE